MKFSVNRLVAECSAASTADVSRGVEATPDQRGKAFVSLLKSSAPQTKNAEKRIFSMGNYPALKRICSQLLPLSSNTTVPHDSDGPPLA
jgi:hypothetical protein